jgi:hypothetical protein
VNSSPKHRRRRKIFYQRRKSILHQYVDEKNTLHHLYINEEYVFGAETSAKEKEKHRKKKRKRRKREGKIVNFAKKSGAKKKMAITREQKLSFR